MIKSKPVIRPIIVDKQKLQELREKLKSSRLSSDAKHAEMKKVVGGVCSRCEALPTKILSYDVEGAQLIEKYCDKCFKKWDKLEKKNHME
ncbi:hypothetical protein BH18THE1_BH18THE1_00850 [soil metagenome]